MCETIRTQFQIWYRFDKLNNHRENQKKDNKRIFPPNIYPLKGNPPKRQIIEKQGAI